MFGMEEKSGMESPPNKNGGKGVCTLEGDLDYKTYVYYIIGNGGKEWYGII